MKNLSATRNRLRRQVLLLMILTLGLGGCIDLSEYYAVRPERYPAKESGRVDEKRLQVVGLALAQLGAPYVWGGSTPDRGFDCSGLVQYTYNNAGIPVPRTAAEQRSQASRKSPSHLLPGDLLFFHINDQGEEHVAIYLGAGEFIHAPSAGSIVRLENFRSPYWQERFYGAGTYL
ncbi:MAG: C40 family peptidase [Gammaproteobacteria bacterium]|nr:C40 family peptidase [Gammaproteobacteria bacterium]MBU1656134.1 C40 family peptidase [Gammaproteobacteria bacterium]